LRANRQCGEGGDRPSSSGTAKETALHEVS
jgi:hypothetical protein